MADSKITGLPASTTPLAGTEVLPVVQSGTTKQVSVANLTAGRDASANKLTLTASDSRLPGGDTAGRVIFGNSDTTAYGAFYGSAHSTQPAWYQIITNSSNVYTYDALGNLKVGAGNLVIGTSGKGINFSGVTPPSGMTSQLLSDYEEGTWTPDLLIAGGNTGVTYTSRSGRYTKTGRLVEIECSVVLSSKGARTGVVRIGGLPYTLAIDALPVTIVPTGTWALLLAGGGVQAYISGTAVYLLLGTTTGTTSLTDANLSNTSAFTFTATFSV